MQRAASHELLTLREAAEILRFSKAKLYVERKAGRLRVHRFGRLVRIDRQELERYVREANEDEWNRKNKGLRDQQLKKFFESGGSKQGISAIRDTQK
jgi:excisionase family DNA binding protein